MQTKLKRKGLEQFGLKKSEPVFKSEQDYKSEAEQQFEKTMAEKDQDNMATQRFYSHELKRGEDLIDDIPVEPYYQYKRQDLKQCLDEKQEEFNKYFSIEKAVDLNRIQKLRKVIRGYEQSKHRYELEEFIKYLEQYPGSLKGKHPEEDPEAFAAYAYKQMPEWVEGELQLQMEGMGGGAMSQPLDDDDIDRTNTASISSMLGSDRKFSFPKSEEDTQEMIDEGIKNDLKTITNVVPYSEIPYEPEVNFEEFHSHFFKNRLWGKFRSFYELRIIEQKFQQLEQVLLKNHEQHVERNGTEAIHVEPAAYSLFTYYKTLPKEIQESPVVRTVYLGLEYSQPDITYAEKEETLNQAAALSLPLDKCTLWLM